MLIQDKCSGNCNSVDDLSARVSVPSRTKDVNVIVFNIIKNKNETKTIVKHILYDCKWKFYGTALNSNQKWNNETCQCECKSYCTG